MLTNQVRNFTGFFKQSSQFLKDLKANNSKLWFEQHKHEYQKFLLEPLRNLVLDLSDFMLSIDPYFEVSPKVNKTISRIYRDTRFSKDKSLFKDRMWIVFKRPIKEWMDAPGYFFEITPNSYRYGMGFYSASKNTMDRFRNFIDETPYKFLEIVSFFTKQTIFTLEGETYKRILDKTKPEDIQNWYQRKNFYLVANHDIDSQLFSPELADALVRDFSMIAPLYQFLLNI